MLEHAGGAGRSDDEEAEVQSTSAFDEEAVDEPPADEPSAAVGDSPEPAAERKRVRSACVACHERKLRCVQRESGPCAECEAKQRACVARVEKKRGRPRKSAVLEQQRAAAAAAAQAALVHPGCFGVATPVSGSYAMCAPFAPCTVASAIPMTTQAVAIGGTPAPPTEMGAAGGADVGSTSPLSALAHFGASPLLALNAAQSLALVSPVAMQPGVFAPGQQAGTSGQGAQMRPMPLQMPAQRMAQQAGHQPPTPPRPVLHKPPPTAARGHTPTQMLPPTHQEGQMLPQPQPQTEAAGMTLAQAQAQAQAHAELQAQVETQAQALSMSLRQAQAQALSQPGPLNPVQQQQQQELMLLQSQQQQLLQLLRQQQHEHRQLLQHVATLQGAQAPPGGFGGQTQQMMASVPLGLPGARGSSDASLQTPNPAFMPGPSAGFEAYGLGGGAMLPAQASSSPEGYGAVGESHEVQLQHMGGLPPP